MGKLETKIKIMRSSFSYKWQAILLFLLTFCFSLQAQQITNVTARQEGKKIVVDYEATGISPEQFYDITLAYSSDGIKWIETQKGLSGAIGKRQQLKNSNQVIWEPLQELPALTSSSIRFQINAKASFEQVTCYGCTEEQKRVVKEIEANMVSIPGGSFWMGCTSDFEGCSSSEKPTHQVVISGFSMSKYEVTQAHWVALMGSNPSKFIDCEKCPVDQVSRNDVLLFIKKLNKFSGQNFRLPTEAEWEYAARGGEQNNRYSGSPNVEAVAWYVDNSESKTHPVGQKLANGFGLYDMSGNVQEWCNDWYGKYGLDSQFNPQGPISGTNGVIRGGSLHATTWSCRISYRYPYKPEFSYYGLGFRLAR